MLLMPVQSCLDGIFSTAQSRVKMFSKVPSSVKYWFISPCPLARREELYFLMKSTMDLDRYVFNC